jgi:uncharacterized protein YecE (DUF72 family)
VTTRQQPSLFDDEEPAEDFRAPLDASTEPTSPGDDPETRALAARLPDGLRFGTSSWSFPGWAGIVYARSRTTQALARDGLREYARHPLLRTVGIDRSYYAPIPEVDLRRYASQLPPQYLCCLKAPASVTSLVMPESARTARAVVNPLFLSVEHFSVDMLEPCARAFAAHTGVIILELPPVPRELRLEPAAFVERLDRFLDALPREFRYSVELRDRRLLTRSYAETLARHRVAHTYNYWSAMPSIAAQAQAVPLDTAPFSVVRLLLRPGTRYEDQREAFRPFNRLVAPDPEMRADVVGLLDRALRARQPAFVLVNNKAEGSSPLTIRALVEQFFDRWNAAASSAAPDAASAV